MKKINRLKIYDTLREFHKNKLFNMNTKDLEEWEVNAIETLSGVLYLVESVFCKDI